MPPRVASTECHVEILAPTGRRFDFRASDYGSALLAVDTRKDIGEACGSFTLHLVATVNEEGRRWDQLIPKRSLVTIRMERPEVPDMGDVETTVMIGLTDTHAVEERWESASPRRQVTIMGREISCLLLDAQLIFHPMLLANPEIGTLTIYTPGPQGAGDGQQPLSLRELALAWNPSMATGGEDPRITLERILDYFLFVGGQAINPPPGVPVTQHPVIQIDLPNVKLPDVLQKNTAAWTTFEPVILPMPFQAAEAGSLWNYLHLYIDRAFQEFFTRIEDGVCKIFFRGKPFRHAYVRSGTRFKRSTGPAGEVDPSEEEPSLKTLTLDPADLLSQHTQCSTTNVYNFFLVSPLGIVSELDSANLKYKIMPQVVTQHDHPSFVGRYGLRPMSVESHYLPPFVPIEPSGGQAGVPMPTAPQPAAPLRTPGTVSKAFTDRQQRYAPLAAQVAAQQGIPVQHRAAFVAMIHTESAFDPMAQSHATPPAQGLGQLIPSTAAQMGVTDPFDPVQSLTGAAKYWNYLRSLPYIGDNIDLILAGYNAGPGRVQQYNGIPPFRETQRHIPLVRSRESLYQGYGGVAPAPTPAAVPTSQGTLKDVGIVKTAQQWAAILMAWHDMGGELFGGTLTVRGHPAWNIGHRVVSYDERGDWEAYIEGVAHRYDMHTGQYVTQLRISRGWYLSADVATQDAAEGQTTITLAVGGPPILDPKTGEPIGEGDVEVIILGPPEEPGVVFNPEGRKRRPGAIINE